ncbi:MAG: hypothetical protein HC852_02045 [Acaryochloridaceae cyanobacterium RU_4_10]|nr:hypothetical protein [Acaryochloridaceae cyanobacterium RU_4_10]
MFFQLGLLLRILRGMGFAGVGRSLYSNAADYLLSCLSNLFLKSLK